eukprot:3167676-Pyramimonas_sp.AAC.1
MEWLSPRLHKHQQQDDSAWRLACACSIALGLRDMALRSHKFKSLWVMLRGASKSMQHALLGRIVSSMSRRVCGLFLCAAVLSPSRCPSAPRCFCVGYGGSALVCG